MGLYSEYLDRQMDFAQIASERKKYLKKISSLRDGNDILVYAADLSHPDPRISMNYEDLVPVKDQLDNLSGDALDMIIETPGGYGETAEDLVKMLRCKYRQVNFIVPGCAKSAGTIMAMSGDEILMDPTSSLGPIDAQLRWRDKTVSADEFLAGFARIKQEVQKSGALNRAFIPILSNISPGEIEHAENALKFAHDLVSDWLTKYKFKNWDTHSTTGKPVTDEERKKRALSIAQKLSDQKHWKTHSRSIKIAELEDLKLRITDYSKSSELNDAITRYFTLLRMSFDATNIYKIFETPTSQIYRFILPPGAQLGQPPQQSAELAILEAECPKCKSKIRIQASFRQGVPLQPGAIAFPPDDQVKCPNCQSIINVKDVRLSVESQTKKRILS